MASKLNPNAPAYVPPAASAAKSNPPRPSYVSSSKVVGINPVAKMPVVTPTTPAPAPKASGSNSGSTENNQPTRPPVTKSNLGAAGSTPTVSPSGMPSHALDYDSLSAFEKIFYKLPPYRSLEERIEGRPLPRGVCDGRYTDFSDYDPVMAAKLAAAERPLSGRR